MYQPPPLLNRAGLAKVIACLSELVFKIASLLSLLTLLHILGTFDL